ncbi:MAG: phosphomannomutase/phosphoglucomutase [Phycisphaerales bacterium]|nr:phosphomannomutase/phosphoglucomutase [Phycisphaerales bacterium]
MRLIPTSAQYNIGQEMADRKCSQSVHDLATTIPRMLEKVFKAYDIRATYPSPLNEAMAWRIGYASARWLTERAAKDGIDSPRMRHIVVGRDMRKSSPSLAHALKRGIRDFGANVVDLGMVDTPMTYFAINHLGCAGGIEVTASHNPAHYNGFKVSRVHAKPVGTGSGLEVIREYASACEDGKVEARGGREESMDLWNAYRDHLLRLLDSSVLDGSVRLRVAIDASNGMAGTMAPKVLDGVAGLEIQQINFDNHSGEFVHEPNPLVEANLESLRTAVIAGKMDFGVCFDGDADRCVIIDEQGKTIGCDLLLAALAGDVLKSAPGAAVVYDLRSSRSVREAIIEAGGVPVESRVGHVFMKARLAETRAPIGGELSGHFYFADMFNADSGIRAFLAVASLVATHRKPLSQIIAPFRRYQQSGEINFQIEDKLGALAALRAAYPTGKFTELDGLSLDAGEWWCNVRMSNTEPLLRLNLEAKDRATVDRQIAALTPLLGVRVEH